MATKKKRSFKIFIIAAIFVAIIAVYGFYKNAEKMAGQSANSDSFSELVADVSDTNDNSIKKYDLKFKTGTERQNNAISTLALRLKIEDKGFEFVNEDGSGLNKLILGDTTSNQDVWITAVNTIYKKDGFYFVDLSVVSKDSKGFQNTDFDTIASFYLKNVSGSGVLTDIETVGEESYAYTKSRPVTNVLRTSQKLEVN